MTLPALTHEQHVLIGALLVALAVVLVAVLWLRHLARNRQRRRTGQHTKSLAGHVATHPGKHLSALALAIIGVVLLVTAGTAAYVLLHHGGATFDPHKRILPPHHQSLGGGNGVQVADLSAPVRARGEVVDQGQTLACCAVTTVRLDELARWRRGETVMPLPLSGFRPYWYLTGGNLYAPSSPVDEATSYTTHGAEPLAYWPPLGYPDVNDALYTTGVGPTSVTWDAYLEGGIGSAGAADALWHLERGEAVGALWDVHYDGDHAVGQAFTWDSGTHAYYHCLPIVGYTSNLAGVGGPAFLLWNSYGTAYGQNGLIWLPQPAFESHVVGLFIEHPGPVVPAWVPKPPAPTRTPTPTISPSAILTARPTPRPTACAVRRLTLRRAANLHTAPKGGTPAVVGVAKGQVVLTVCPAQAAAGWVRVQAGARVGWLSTAAL